MRGMSAPRWLRENADPDVVGCEQPADHRHAKTRVVDMGIACHRQDVAGDVLQSYGVHLRIDAFEAGRRILVASDVACGLREHT